MTTTLRLTDGSYMRQTDTERIIQLLSSSRCVRGDRHQQRGQVVADAVAGAR